MGSLFKSKTKAIQQPFESEPWEPQQPYLEEGFEQALQQLNNSLGGLGNFKDPVADLNQQQLNQIQSGINLGNLAQGAGLGMAGQGQGLAQLLGSAAGNIGNIDRVASGLMGQGNQFAGQMSQLAGQTAQTGNQFLSTGQRANQAAQNAGNNLLALAGQGAQAGQKDTAALGGMINQNAQQNLNGANQFSQNATGIADLSGNYASQIGDNLDQSSGASQGVLDRSNQLYGNGDVSGILSDAQKVADNPYLQSQIDNAISDVQRGFQNTQAQINANASGAGGMNSTRAGLLESRALEAAQRTAGNISSQMRSDAYNTGLNTALQNKSQNNALLNTQLGAGQQQMGINDQRMNLAGQDLQTRLNANNQFGAGQQMAQDARNTAVSQTFDNAMLGQGIRNDQFSQTSLAHNTNLSGYDSLLAALQGQVGAQNTAGNLLGSAAGTALNAGTAGLEALMGNNAQRAQLGSIGNDLINGGFGLASGGNVSAYDAASRLQNQAQAEIDGRLGLNGAGLDLVAQYLGAIGGNYGTQGYQTSVSKSPSPFQQIVGGASSLIGAFG